MKLTRRCLSIILCSVLLAVSSSASVPAEEIQAEAILTGSEQGVQEMDDMEQSLPEVEDSEQNEPKTDASEQDEPESDEPEQGEPEDDSLQQDEPEQDDSSAETDPADEDTPVEPMANGLMIVENEPVEPMGDGSEIKTITPYDGAAYQLKYYITNQSEAYIVGFEGDAEGLLVIPLTIEGKHVTEIGTEAFYRRMGTDFTGPLMIPKYVKHIYPNAFCGCSSITSLTLSNDLKYIDDYAFCALRNIKTLSIPDRVETIGAGAFQACSSLKRVTFGLNGNSSNLTTIGSSAFYGCALTGNLTIPDSVTSIGGGAFWNCSNLNGTLTIGNSVGSIGDAAFRNCPLHGDLIIPDSVETIGKEAFRNANQITGLSIGSGVKTIGEMAFCDCSNLTGALTIPDNVESIGKEAFLGCGRLTALSIGSGVSSIGDGAFKRCSNITGELVLPENLESIGAGAFNECTSLTGTLSIPVNVTSIGESAFEGCTGFSGNLTIPGKVRTIGDKAFYGCGGLNGDLTIGSLLQSIDGTSAFSGCHFCGDLILFTCKTEVLEGILCNDFSWKDLRIRYSVRSIPADAFAGEYFSGQLIFQPPLIIGNTGLKEIGDRAFMGAGFSGPLTFPSTLETIGASAFEGCSGLTGSLVIPDNVRTVESNAFKHCSGLTGTLTIPDRVTKIGAGAFEGCSFTGSLNIPDRVTSIGDRAFYGCSGFSGSLVIPSKVKTIGNDTFYGCSGFSGSLTIPDTTDAVTIGTGAFYGCSGLNGNLTIGSNVTSVGKDAFTACGFTGDLIVKNCEEETLAYFPSFNISWNNLKIGDNIETIPLDAFAGMDFNGTLTIGSSVKLIGAYAFQDCSGFTGEIVIPASVTTIGESAFDGCAGFTGGLNITDGVIRIGNYAFRGCRSLSGSVTIPASVKVIGQDALPLICADENRVIYHARVLNSITNNSTVPLTLPAAYEYLSGDSYVTDDSCAVYWKDESGNRVTRIKNGQTAVLYTEGEHNHSFTYTAEGATITAKCTPECMIVNGLSITISAPADLNYDGNAKAATLNDDYSRIAFPGTYEIKYYQEEREIAAADLKNPGRYTAKAVIEEQTISVDFVITTDQPEEGIFEDQEEYSHSVILDRVYTGKAICPKPVIRWKGMVLTEGSDYTLSYKNNINVSSKYAGKNAPLVIVKGIGNYTKTMEIPFDIVKKPLGNGTVYADDISVTIANAKYTGKAVNNKPVVKYGSITLKDGTDYKLAYSPLNPVEPGDVTVTISATDKNYTGEVTATYSICDNNLDLSRSTVIVEEDTVVYTGAECRPAVAVYLGETTVDASDYTLDYSKNTDVGTATVTVIGTGGYCGSKSAKFKITQKPLNTAAITVAEEYYSGTALKPAIIVKDGDTEIPASNYTLKYTNNTDAASPEHPIIKGNKQLIPTVSVKFKGNYSGTAEKYFTIAPKAVAEADLSVTFPDVKESANELTEDALKPTVKYGKKTLKKGTDYNLELTDKNGQIQNVKVKLVGNYTGTCEYAFRVYAADADMTVTALTATPEYATTVYDGNKKTPKMTVKTTIGDMQWTLTEGKDYTVTYSNNINARAAGGKQSPTWKVTGKGAYKGSLTGTFEITARELNSDDFAVSVADIKESNGKEVKPKVTVTEKATGKELKSGKDYQIAYANNTVAREDNAEDAPKVTVSGIGNYQTPENANKVLSDTFRIYRKDISGVTVVGLDSMDYTGQQVKPAGFTVYADSKKSEAGRLTENTHYTISYGENTAAGKGTVILKGIGEYGGEKTLKFVILPKWLSWLNALL